LYKYSVKKTPEAKLKLNLPIQIVERELFIDLPPGAYFEAFIPESSSISLVDMYEKNKIVTNVYIRADELIHTKDVKKIVPSESSKSNKEDELP
jgi:hypothetical protein